MSSSIPPDDLQEDMWICLRDHPEEEEPLPSFLHLSTDRRIPRIRAAIAAGRPMRIIAVDLPFIHVVPIDREGDEVGPYLLDTREHRLFRSHEKVGRAYREFNARRKAMLRERMARERHEDAMKEVDIEVERYQRLARAGALELLRRVKDDAEETDIVEALMKVIELREPGTETSGSDG